MRYELAIAALFAANFAAAPVRAELYKWVDQNGVTNYAGKPPANASSVKNMDGVPQRLSTYTPDAALVSAMALDSQQRSRNMSTTGTGSERSIDTARHTTGNSNTSGQLASQAAIERCIAERRVDCDAPMAPVYPPVIRVASRGQVTPFTPIVTVTGATAGNVIDTISATGAVVSRTPGAFPGVTPGQRPVSTGRSSRSLSSR